MNPYNSYSPNSIEMGGLTNLKNEPVQLQLGEPTCGCTKAVLSEETVGPKSTVTLEISLGAEDKAICLASYSVYGAAPQEQGYGGYWSPALEIRDIDWGKLSRGQSW